MCNRFRRVEKLTFQKTTGDESAPDKVSLFHKTLHFYSIQKFSLTTTKNSFHFLLYLNDSFPLLCKYYTKLADKINTCHLARLSAVANLINNLWS